MLWKYTLRYLKNHKKQTTMFIAFMTIMMSAMFVLSVFASYNMNVSMLENKENSGSWQLRLEYDGDVAIFKDAPYVLKHVVATDSEGEELAFFEGDFETIIKYHLSEGRLPETENEIAISLKRLKELQVEPVLNSYVTLEFGTYQLVGITDYVDNDTNGSYPSYLVCPQAYETRFVYLGGQKNENIVHELGLLTYGENKAYSSTYSTGFSDDAMLLRDNMYYLGQILIISFFSLILMLNYTYLNLTNRVHDYVLLRGIGALKKQLYMMSLMETSLLFICALPLSLLIGFGFAYYESTVQTTVPLSLLFPWSVIIQNVIIGYVISLCSNCIPVTRSIQNALTGEFNQQEVKLILRPRRKLKKLTFFELAKIKIGSNKKSIIFMTIVLVVTMMNVFKYVDSHMDLKAMNDTVDFFLQAPFLDEEQLSNTPKEDFLNEKSITYTEMDCFKANVEYFGLENLSFESAEICELKDEVFQMTKTVPFTGRLPENDHELLAYSILSDFNGNNISLPGIKIQINGEEYEIVGQFDSLEFLWSYNSMIENGYYRWISNPCIIYMEPELITEDFEFIQTKSLIQYDGGKIENKRLERLTNKMLDPLYQSNGLALTKDQKMFVKTVSMSVVLIIMYFFAQIQRRNQMREYVMDLKRLGLTKLEILQIYGWESFLINVVISFLAFIVSHFTYGLAFNIYAIGVYIVLLLIFMIIYMVPVGLIINEKGDNLWKSF